MIGVSAMTRAPPLCSEQEAAAPVRSDEPERGRGGQTGEAKANKTTLCCSLQHHGGRHVPVFRAQQPPCVFLPARELLRPRQA